MRCGTAVVIASLCVHSVAYAATYAVTWDGDGQTNIDGDSFCQGKCQPGDVIEITSTTDTLYMEDFFGSEGNPIVVRNSPAGQALLNAKNSSPGIFGITMVDGDHIRITGTGAGVATCSGTDQSGCGIKIIGCATIGIRTGSSTEQVDHLEIDHVEITGKTTNSRPHIGISIHAEAVADHHMHGLAIHDCYVHDIDGEILYIGSENLPERNLYDVKVYNNYFADCGYEAIQFRRVKGDNNEIYGNTIINWGYYDPEPPGGDDRGISISSSKARIYNNKMLVTNPSDYCDEPGILVTSWKSAAEAEIFNNVIDMGGQGSHAIGVGKSSIPDMPEPSVAIYQNTIANAKDGGVTVWAGTVTMRDNIICSPGGSYINCYGTCTDTNNLKSDCSANRFANLANDDFSLTSDSPARDTGSATGYPATDIVGNSRPEGGAVDRGAYEYIVEQIPAAPDNLRVE